MALTNIPEHLAWHPDGQQLAIAAGKEIFIWNSVAATPPQLFGSHTGVVGAVSFNASGTRLASSDGTGRTKVFAFPSGQELISMQTDAYHLFFSGSDRQLAVVSRNEAKLKLIDVAGGEDVLRLALPGETSPTRTNMPQFSVDSSAVITRGANGWRWWSTANGALLRMTEVPPAAVATTSTPIVAEASENTLTLLRADSRAMIAQLALPGPAPITGATIARDGEFLVICRRDSAPQLWRLQSIRGQLAQMKLDW